MQQSFCCYFFFLSNQQIWTQPESNHLLLTICSCHNYNSFIISVEGLLTSRFFVVEYLNTWSDQVFKLCQCPMVFLICLDWSTLLGGVVDVFQAKVRTNGLHDKIICIANKKLLVLTVGLLTSGLTSCLWMRSCSLCGVPMSTPLFFPQALHNDTQQFHGHMEKLSWNRAEAVESISCCGSLYDEQFAPRLHDTCQ